jgi:hypothetical protein
LIALYRQPPPAAFDKHYHEVHLPLVKTLPGLARTVINRSLSPPGASLARRYGADSLIHPPPPRITSIRRSNSVCVSPSLSGMYPM